MRITRLKLSGFRRMALNNVLTFEITPTEPIQMILGTNGSGKSSLIYELTPLPADPAAYLPDGCKTIEITHRGSFYVLTSNFAVTKVHSFVKDGEELNPGGGVTVQREFVKKEFDITPEIHELLTGIERFTEMVPGRRRDWFTRLSDISYDYALAVFKKLAERSRDVSGALKLNKKRLVSESAKVISEAEEQKLKDDVDVTTQELNILLQQRAPLDRPIEELRSDQGRGFEELARLSKRLLNMRFTAPYGGHYGLDTSRPAQRNDLGEVFHPGFTSLEEIDSYIDGVRHRITGKETLLNQAVQEHAKIDETLKILARAGEAGLKELLEKRIALQHARETEFTHCQLGIEGLNAEHAAHALESVHELLTATFSAIPDNEDRRYSQQRMTELNDKIIQTKDKQLRLGNELAHLQAEKSKAEAHKANGQMRCRQCGFVWTEGYNDEQYAKLLETIADKEEDKAKLTKELEGLEADVTLIREYGSFYGDYLRCVRNWPVLQPFWDYLTDEELVTRSPRKALATVGIFKQDLVHEVAASKLTKEIEELSKLIADTEQVGDANYAETKQKLDECTLRVEAYTAELALLQANLSAHATYRRQLAEALELGERIRSSMSAQEKLTRDLVEAIRRDTLAHCVRQLQHSLAIKQSTLNEAQSQRKVVTDLQNHINDLVVQEEAARALVKQLSPTDGLIAEGLFGFIRNFTGQMNNLIRKIWSYPLQVMDCGMASSEGAELDYKFPLLVQTKSNVVPDVKRGSSGMREIVDLAFMVVAMRYLGLEQSSLFLDEFGARFDETHRTAAATMIKSLMDTQPFTQLFMISHYQDFHGVFTNAQVCVLDASNITVPATHKYNQHVVIA